MLLLIRPERLVFDGNTQTRLCSGKRLALGETAFEDGGELR